MTLVFFVLAVVLVYYLYQNPQVPKRVYKTWIEPYIFSSDEFIEDKRTYTDKGNGVYVQDRRRDEIQENSLTKINFNKLQNEITNRYNEPIPFTVKGQERQNEEFRLLAEKIRLISQQLEAMNNMGDNLLKLNVDSLIRQADISEFVSEELIRKTRLMHKEALNYELDLKRIALENEQLNGSLIKEKINTAFERTKMSLEMDSLRADTEIKRADIYQIKNHSDVEMLIAQAEVNFQEAKKDREIVETKFIRDVLIKIDPTALPPELQTYLVASVFNKNNHSYDEHVNNNRLKEILDLKAKADIEKTKAEAGKIRSDTEYKSAESEGVKTKNEQEKWKLDETRKRRN